LHHVAANGIEVERQLQSPPNATQVMRLLLDRGYFATGVPEGNLLEQALGSAAQHGRRDVVEFLLGERPDLSFTDPSFGVTARGAAAYAGHTAIVALIDEWLASS
jgi:hypothetical protein